MGSVHGDGVAFAFARATEGTASNDSDFSGNMSRGKSAGVKWALITSPIQPKGAPACRPITSGLSPAAKSPLTANQSCRWWIAKNSLVLAAPKAPTPPGTMIGRQTSRLILLACVLSSMSAPAMRLT